MAKDILIVPGSSNIHFSGSAANDIKLETQDSGSVAFTSNSGSILNLSDSLYNTVRVGILAYGVSPSDEVTMKINVEPVMSFCSPIINIRRVSENTQISYGGIYKTKN